jgi:hypothetical protein
MVFGEVWPSMRSFRIPQDFYAFDTSRGIEIIVWFDPPYVHEDDFDNRHQVNAVRLSCKPYQRSGKWGTAGDLHVDLEPLNAEGDVPLIPVTPRRKGVKPQFRPLPVGTALREQNRVLFVDHRRSVLQHLPTVRGSILAKLLEPARREFTAEADFRKAYETAMECLRTEQVRELEKRIQDTAKRMLGFLGRGVAKSIEIGFGFADPSNPFNSLRLQYREGDLEVPAEELGLGIQSAIVVGLFDAFRQLGGEFQTIVIEEPEMYLHPQAQRYFYRLLREMVEASQCQVIYSTHSPIFADVNLYETLRLVRKDPGQSSSVTYVSVENYERLAKERERQKLAGQFNPARNEVFFAKKALLVEGPADRSAVLIVAERMNLDIDAEGITVIDCGGKNGIPLVASVCTDLGIPFLVLHDEDIWPEDKGQDPARQAKENEVAQAENARILEAAGGQDRVLLIKPSLEAALNIGRNAKDKPQKVVERVRSMNLDEIPKELVAVVNMLFESNTCESTEVISPGEVQTRVANGGWGLR